MAQQHCGHCGAVNTPAGIGLEPTLAEHIANIVDVFRELRRVLRDDGTAWLNYGDAYAGSGKGLNGDGTIGVINSDKQASNTGSLTGRKTDTGIPAKSLMGLPWRVAFALQDDGWILRSAIVWHKPNPMPESVSDRPTSAYENVFLLAKSNVPRLTGRIETNEGHANGLGRTTDGSMRQRTPSTPSSLTTYRARS